MFTQSAGDEGAYKGLLDGLRRLYVGEGVRGLYKVRFDLPAKSH